MELSKQRLTISKAKEIDMVGYLVSIGFQPAKIRGNDYWYLSPLRDEKTPSFKVSRKLNRWYDHGIGKGGNLVDFAVLFFACGVVEVLEKLSGNFSFQQHPVLPVKIDREADSKIKIVNHFSIASYPLIAYLKERAIPISIAEKYCREVRYELNGKPYYGIGFRNDLGGFEIRNAWHKLSSSPKGITSIKNGGDGVAVFEGFFDFLSFMVIHGYEAFKQYDYVILNSLAFLEKAFSILDAYKTAHLFLDNDTAGESCCKLAIARSNSFRNASNLYEDCNDLNQYLTGSGTAEMYRNPIIKDSLPGNNKPSGLTSG